jgi:alkaline phosphatase
MDYRLKADAKKEPSLQDMTKFAIKSLQSNPNGFFLFVEGKRIYLRLYET